ncbi:MAG TPA: hypothetical protein VFC53_08390 [Dehalococcoidia bacterium]|jgi:hypothetical protein|nr:hypothetical protein [Dehalococcoidia bacterium]
MTTTSPIVLDPQGRPMFFCATCGGPLTQDDFFAQELRLPERGETRDDYCDAELIDSLKHAACARSSRAG